MRLCVRVDGLSVCVDSLSVCVDSLANKQDLSSSLDVDAVSQSLRVDELADKHNSALRVVSTYSSLY